MNLRGSCQTSTSQISEKQNIYLQEAGIKTLKHGWNNIEETVVCQHVPSGYFPFDLIKEYSDAASPITSSGKTKGVHWYSQQVWPCEAGPITKGYNNSLHFTNLNKKFMNQWFQNIPFDERIFSESRSHFQCSKWQTTFYLTFNQLQYLCIVQCDGTSFHKQDFPFWQYLNIYFFLDKIQSQVKFKFG